MSSLLIAEPPLVVSPTLATKIGLVRAIILQQLHYWASQTDDGWVYNTIQGWNDQFPFWSEATTKRGLQELRDRDLVEVRQPKGRDRTNHYRVNYAKVDKVAPSIGSSRPDPSAHPAPLSINTETTYREEDVSGPGKSNPSKKLKVGDAGPKIAALYDLWLQETERDPTRWKLTPARREKLLARLGDSAIEEIEKAIRNVGASKWHRGENDRGRRYDDLTQICRSRDKLEEYRDMEPKRPKGKRRFVDERETDPDEDQPF